MRKRTLARHTDPGWTRPYGVTPFSPIFYADGGGGEGSGSGGQPGSGEPTPGGNGTGGQGSGQGGQPSGQNPDPSGNDPAATIARLERDLTAARQEAAKSRTTAKQNAANEARQELAQTIGKALGIVQDDQPADPAELTRTITEKTSRIGELETTVRTQAIELAAYKAADRHGANPAALLDSRSFLASVAELDPAAADFTTKLDDAIKAAVDANQQLRTGQAPRRGGGDFAGGPGTQQRPTSLHAAIAAKLGG
jgi:hypothetical protein